LICGAPLGGAAVADVPRDPATLLARLHEGAARRTSRALALAASRAKLTRNAETCLAKLEEDVAAALEAVREHHQRMRMDVLVLVAERLKVLQADEDVAWIDAGQLQAHVAALAGSGSASVAVCAGLAACLVNAAEDALPPLKVAVSACVGPVRAALLGSILVRHDLELGEVAFAGRGLAFFQPGHECPAQFSVTCTESNGEPADWVCPELVAVRVEAEGATSCSVTETQEAGVLRVSYLVHEPHARSATVRVTVPGKSPFEYLAKSSVMTGSWAIRKATLDEHQQGVLSVAPDGHVMVTGGARGPRMWSCAGVPRNFEPLSLVKAARFTEWGSVVVSLHSPAGAIQELTSKREVVHTYTAGGAVLEFDVRGELLALATRLPRPLEVVDLRRQVSVATLGEGLHDVLEVLLSADKTALLVACVTTPQSLTFWEADLGGSTPRLLFQLPKRTHVRMALTPSGDLALAEHAAINIRSSLDGQFRYAIPCPVGFGMLGLCSVQDGLFAYSNRWLCKVT